MTTRKILGLITGLSLLAHPVHADLGDVVGGVIGGVVAGAVISNSQKKRTTTVRRTTPSSGAWSAQRHDNANVQKALNYFGFPVGGADGVFGSKTRTGISNYQAYMAFPITGQLTDFEKNFLLTSHSRAVAGGFRTQELIAENPDGQRGLLAVYREAQMGPREEEKPESDTTLKVTSPGGLVIPNAAQPNPGETIASHCNRVSLRTTVNGGFMTSANFGDPDIALDEQFCLARTYAIEHGNNLTSEIIGVTQAQIDEQCKQFGPLLKAQVNALSVADPAPVMQDVGNFILSTGYAPADLQRTAEICLSVGYRTDDLDVTLASALMLTVLGEGAYAELMGHHIRGGFGATKRQDLAVKWYVSGLQSLQQGSAPVFAAAMPGRSELMEKSIVTLASFSTGTQTAPAAPAAPAAMPGVPVFSIQQ